MYIAPHEEMSFFFSANIGDLAVFFPLLSLAVVLNYYCSLRRVHVHLFYVLSHEKIRAK